MAAVEGRVVGAERVVSVKRVTTWSHHHSRCHAHLHALDSRNARAARPPATWTTAAPAARSLIVPSELGLIRSPSRPRLSGTREHTAPSAPLGARTRTQRTANDEAPPRRAQPDSLRRAEGVVTSRPCQSCRLTTTRRAARASRGRPCLRECLLARGRRGGGERDVGEGRPG